LTQTVKRPDLEAHRYESWRAMADALKIELPPREQIFIPVAKNHGTILIHTGAGQPVRVWPLENYQKLAARLRQKNLSVQIACDPDQRDWWLKSGEKNVLTPVTVTELIELTDRVGIFIGNDSGPGHLAAFCGVPTFTVFGPQLPEWFAPLHPRAQWIEGKACPYLPCSDYCRFPKPFCIRNVTEEEVWQRVEKFTVNRLA
jgi:ADP-heptose:LPS heptosyltransferase